MHEAFLPVFLFAACSIGLAIGLLLISRLFNPGHPSRVTRMPYESGMDPIHDTRRRFDVRFHILAIAFMLFDVELLFLYPWAVAVRGEKNYDRLVVSANVRAGSVETHSALQGLGGSPPSDSAKPRSHFHSLTFAGAMTFILLLTLGYVYDWRKGIFQWR